MLRLTRFGGEHPRIAPRLLPQEAAVTAIDTRLDSGSLRPLRGTAFVADAVPGAASLTRHRGIWYSWPGSVDAVPGPVADDRLYLTGLGSPQVIAPTGMRPLAVRPPATSPAVAVSGTLNSDLASTVLYAYTVVTDLDEESPPSPASAPVLLSPGMSAEVGGLTVDQSGRGIDRFRLYRSQTSALGTTDFFFIAELPSTATGFSDDPAAIPAQEGLPSQHYDPPPDGLTGLIALPNGVMAGFVGKRLYLSEPYRPHAWPETYALTTDHDIVALGAFASSIVIATTGPPYVAQGVEPGSLAMERLEVALPCLSARGLVDLGYAVAYPAPDGLVLIGQGGARVVTETLFSRDQWQALQPGGMIAAAYDGRYVVSHPEGAGRAVLLIDLAAAQPVLVRSAMTAEALFTDPADGALFVLAAGEIRQWDAAGAAPRSLRWRSKPWHLPTPVNFGAVRVDGEGAITTTVIADGSPVHTTTVLNRPTRLPAGFLASVWQVEIAGTGEVTAVTLAESPAGLRRIEG